jgi:hypothetical protein
MNVSDRTAFSCAGHSRTRAAFESRTILTAGDALETPA